MSAFTYKWTLDNPTLNEVKKAFVGQTFCSPIFCVFGCKWCLEFAPNGYDEKDDGQAGIYLTLASHPPDIKQVKAQYTLQLESEQHDVRYELSNTFGTNTTSDGKRKTSISFAAIQQLNELTFSTALAVENVVDIDDTDVTSSYAARSYVRKHSRKKKAGHRAVHEFEWKIADESLLDQMKKASLKHEFQSEEFYAFGSRWRLFVCPNGDDREGFVALYLKLEAMSENVKSVGVAFTLQCMEMHIKSDCVYNYRSEEHAPDEESYGWSEEILPTEKIQNCKSLTFKVNLEVFAAYGDRDEDVLSALADEWDEFQKKETAYELSKEHGDVVLMLDDTNSDDDISEPPRKKRRLDDDAKNGSLNSDQVRVCSVILRAESKIFDNTLRNDTMERKEKKIMIRSEHIKDVDDLWYFVCTGVLRPDCDVFNVIALAHMYELKKMVKKCTAQLIRDLSVDSWVRTVLIFDRYEIEEDFDKLLLFAGSNVEALRKRDDWRRLPHSFRQCITTVRIDLTTIDI